MPRVLVSRAFQRSFDVLDDDTKARVREGLDALAEDPRSSRSGADIKRLSNTDPVKHRLRVGSWRIVYRIDEDAVRVLDLFQRGRGYRA